MRWSRFYLFTTREVPGDAEVVSVRGRHLESGWPRAVDIDSNEVRIALQEPLHKISEAVLDNDLPFEMVGDLDEQGFSPELTVPDAHREVLIQVGAYARQQGHVAAEGINCGIDYFISGDDVIVTEINARWTGGLFPAEFLRRLQIDSPAIAFFDMVPCADSEAMQAFQREHLFPARGGAFSYVPMGFTPFAMEVEGADHYFVWQVVVGDFAAFVEAKERALPSGALPTANLILEEALQ